MVAVSTVQRKTTGRIKTASYILYSLFLGDALFCFSDSLLITITSFLFRTQSTSPQAQCEATGAWLSDSLAMNYEPIIGLVFITWAWPRLTYTFSGLKGQQWAASLTPDHWHSEEFHLERETSVPFRRKTAQPLRAHRLLAAVGVSAAILVPPPAVDLIC